MKGQCHCQAVEWTYTLNLESVTACNCTLCRRYGALWAYGFLEDGVTVSGSTQIYVRGSQLNGYHFCKRCGCLPYYLSQKPDQDGKRRIAVNLRMLTEPQSIMALPIDHFDGLGTFEDLPRDDRTVCDLWF